MSKNRKHRAFTKNIRNSRMQYTIQPATVPDHFYITIIRRTYSGTNKPTYGCGPSVYKACNIPPWASTGMTMIDIAVDPATKVAHIPGFGGKYRDKFVFYAEGMDEEPNKFD